MHSWTPDDMPCPGGTTAVVTGANSGIGAVTALVLARSGARTVLARRDEPARPTGPDAYAV
ncbi:short chain dehydrogenase [Streptomyces sp. ADI98-10]|nr:short chain dehydrogenase [Streptomyces sp. ADI98-10]